MYILIIIRNKFAIDVCLPPRASDIITILSCFDFFTLIMEIF